MNADEKVRKALSIVLDDGELVADAVIVYATVSDEGSATHLMSTGMLDWKLRGLLYEGIKMVDDEPLKELDDG